MLNKKIILFLSFFIAASNMFSARSSDEEEKQAEIMPVRTTSRIILFDKNDKILLMQISDNTVKSSKTIGDKPPFWVTIGGKVEDSESLEEAAQRELFEETGISGVDLSKCVWYGEQTLDWKGTQTKLHENFFFAKTNTTNISTSNLTLEETKVVKQYKWWNLEELKDTSDLIFPPKLSCFLENIFPYKEYIFDNTFTDFTLPIKIDISD